MILNIPEIESMCFVYLHFALWVTESLNIFPESTDSTCYLFCNSVFQVRMGIFRILTLFGPSFKSLFEYHTAFNISLLYFGLHRTHSPASHFFRSVFDIFGSLCFHVNFIISVSSFITNLVSTLMRIT